MILTRESALGTPGEVTIAPVTSTVRGFPAEVERSPADGMRQVCAVNRDHLQTVAKGRLGALVESLGPGNIADVAKAIRFALDLRGRRMNPVAGRDRDINRLCHSNSVEALQRA